MSFYTKDSDHQIYWTEYCFLVAHDLFCSLTDQLLYFYKFVAIVDNHNNFKELSFNFANLTDFILN